MAQLWHLGSSVSGYRTNGLTHWNQRLELHIVSVPNAGQGYQTDHDTFLNYALSRSRLCSFLLYISLLLTTAGYEIKYVFSRDDDHMYGEMTLMHKIHTNFSEKSPQNIINMSTDVKYGDLFK